MTFTGLNSSTRKSKHPGTENTALLYSQYNMASNPVYHCFPHTISPSLTP